MYLTLDHVARAQISRYTYKIVENDPYGQYPFLYAIKGVDKCVVIDTGTGIGDFKAYVDRNINVEGYSCAATSARNSMSCINARSATAQAAIPRHQHTRAL